MKWKYPHISKIYEALGAIADNRVEVVGNTAKVYSSSRNKFYDIEYDPVSNEIMSNDNSSFWKGELGYPPIAFLMKMGVLSFDEKIADLLKGIPWKDINQNLKIILIRHLSMCSQIKLMKNRKLSEILLIK